jgi:rhodanese-related sulfurtransferase
MKLITREEIKKNIDESTSMIIVEALPEKYFNDMHLPGAINIPHDQVKTIATSKLPDKEALIVVYCANSACQNSNIAAQTLLQMGYQNVYEYAEGKQHWLEANLPIETVI